MRVRDGYARNAARPQEGAASHRSQKEHFGTQRAQIEADNLTLKKEAEAVAETLNGQAFVVIRRPAKAVIYTARSRRATSRKPRPGGFTLNRDQIVLNHPIKALGLHNVPVHCIRKWT